MSVIDKYRFEPRGGHGCSNSDYLLRRTRCCGSFGVEDDELQDFYTDPTDLRKTVMLTYHPRSESPPCCPFCGAREWDMVEITNAAEVPDAWRWAMKAI